MAMLPALPKPEYGRNEMMVLDNNVLVGEIVDAIADNQQMVPGFEEFMNTMQTISNSLNEISIGLSEMSSRFSQMFDNVLVAQEIKPEQSDTSDKDKLFTTLETLVAVSFLTLEAIRALPDSFGKTVEKDQKAEEKFSKKDALSLKEKDIESSFKKPGASNASGGIIGTIKDVLMKLITPLLGFFIGFFAAGGSFFELVSLMFDKLVETISNAISNLFNSLFTAIKDAFIGFVINPIISVLNTIPGIDIEPVMTTEEKARAAGQNTTGTDQIGSTIAERATAKGLIKGATVLSGGALVGMEAVDRAKGLFGKQTAETVGKETTETAGKTAAKNAGKFGLKSALKKIPLLGLAFGGAFAAQRALEGDFAGAGLELASGAAGAIPGVGTMSSLGIDALLAASDTMGYTGAAAIQDRNNFGATPSASQLKSNLDMARQSTEEVRLRPQQQTSGNVNSVVVGGTNVNNARTEIIQPPPNAGTDMGIPRKT